MKILLRARRLVVGLRRWLLSQPDTYLVACCIVLAATAAALILAASIAPVFPGSNDLFWRLLGLFLAVMLGSVAAWGAVTARKVRYVLRTELPGWQWLLLDAAREIASMGKEEDLWLMSYSPNIGDISIRDESEHAEVYVPFLEALEGFAHKGGKCRVICYSERSLGSMLRSLRAYAEKRLSTYGLVNSLERQRNASVWRADYIPPQHLLIVGTRIGYRFLVAADLPGRRHRVRAIRTEERAEIEHMRAVWSRCCAQLAGPKSEAFGFWLSVDRDGCAEIWAQFDDQANAFRVEVQSADDPGGFESVSSASVLPDGRGWSFDWQPGGLFRRVRSEGNGPSEARKYFRTRIVKKKGDPAVVFKTEWSDPVRMFLAPRGEDAASGEALTLAIREGCEAILLKARTAASTAAFEKDRFSYEFVHSYPPRAVLQRVQVEDEAKQLLQSRRHRDRALTDHPISVYVHVPFCLRVCHYCHYCTGSWHPVAGQRYLEALAVEIAMVGRLLGKPPKVGSVYFGGGTPTLFTQPLAHRGMHYKTGLEWILELLQERFEFAPSVQACEKTCECTPETLDPGVLRALSGAAESSRITRLSIGVQSFDDWTLRRDLGRGYDGAKAAAVLADAAEAGFERVNIDLIYGLPSSQPGMWLPQWEHTIARTSELMPPSVTLYQLRVKHGTPMGDASAWPEDQFPPNEQILLMPQIAREVLGRVGYREVAPEFFLLDELAARPPLPRHSARMPFFGYQGQKASNLGFLGFGASAYSYFNEAVFCNESDVETYIGALTGPKPRLPITHGQALGDDDLWRRFAIMGLRYGGGVDLQECADRYGNDKGSALRGCLEPLTRGADSLLKLSGRQVQPTELGLLYVDEVCRSLYSDDVLNGLKEKGRRYGAYSSPGRTEPVSP